MNRIGRAGSGRAVLQTVSMLLTGSANRSNHVVLCNVRNKDEAAAKSRRMLPDEVVSLCLRFNLLGVMGQLERSEWAECLTESC